MENIEILRLFLEKAIEHHKNKEDFVFVEELERCKRDLLYVFYC